MVYPINLGGNAVKIYDPNFDVGKTYEIEIKAISFCLPSLKVSVDSVSFCGSNATFYFELPCLENGYYKLSIYDTSNPSELLYGLKTLYSS